MSVVQDLCYGDQQASQERSGAQASINIPSKQYFPNTQLCIDKNWVESSSNQWPEWTESHLNFLIQRFGLHSILQENITHFSIDAILQATTIYLEKDGWENRHEERLWEKLNLKVGYMHAALNGQRNKAMVDHECRARLSLRAMHRKNLSNLALSRILSMSASGYRPQPPPASNWSLGPGPSLTPITPQYKPDINTKKHAMDIWISMSVEEQADLLHWQLRTPKNFNNLIMVVNRRCKYVQASRARRAGRPTPPNDSHVWDINTNTSSKARANTNPNALSLRTDLFQSEATTEKADDAVALNGGLQSPSIIFDGFPSPTTKPLDSHWSISPISPIRADGVTTPEHSKDDVHDDHDEIREINEHEFTNPSQVTQEPKETLFSDKPMDVKAIIDHCVRELELKRKREKETAAQEEMRKTSEEEEQDPVGEEGGINPEKQDDVEVMTGVEEEEFEERRKRCKIQTAI